MIKMMVVEDERILRDGICRVGKWGSHDVEICGTAGNGQEALELIGEQKPDIILTDVVMPVMDGIELAKRVYEQYPEIRMIFLSGHEEFDYVKKAMEYKYGLKEATTIMLGNGRCKINPRKFQNDMTTFATKDDVLTLLVYLGYLTFDETTEEVFIPNQEIMYEFLNAVDDPGWNGVIQSLRRSEKLLESTWMLDGKAVAEGVAIIHNETASILKYNGCSLSAETKCGPAGIDRRIEME